MIDDDTIRKIAGKADNVVITSDVNHKEIGLKVGLFSMATTINPNMGREDQERCIRNLYMDLKVMNMRQDEQVRYAQEEARGARS